MHLGFIFTYLVVAILSSAVSHATVKLCGSAFEAVAPRAEKPAGLEVRGDRFDDYASFNFNDHSNIVFLSDGGRSAPAKLMPQNRTKNLVSTDLNPSSGVDIVADNNRLPLKDDAFDLVLMNRGLCQCRPTPRSCMTCGGIAPKAAEMRNFLRSVARFLDKKSPNSIAVLTGFDFNGPLGPSRHVPKMWISAAQALKLEYPELEWTILYSQHTGIQPDWVNGGVLGDPDHFVGIAVSTKGETSVGDRLKSLRPSILFDSSKY